MNDVSATPLPYRHMLRHGIHGIEIHSDNMKSLVLLLDGGKLVPTIKVEIKSLVGFRVLEEHHLLEFWGACQSYYTSDWIWQIHGNGWLSQESKRNDSFHGSLIEYLVATEDWGISIICREEPKISEVPGSNGLAPQVSV